MSKEKIKKDDVLEENNVEEVKDEKGSILNEGENISQKNIWSKIWKVIRIILLGITSPIWFPWKVLFVRKKGRKYSEVDTKTRVFRILRSPLTKPLKFCVYLLIISAEFLVIYKASNSFVSYPFKKSSVQSYYLNYASMNNYKEEFEKTFDYIDDWSFSAKGNMYTFYNSKVVKTIFEKANPDTVNHFLNKFNNDKEFRDNIESVVTNSNKLVKRLVSEYKDEIDAGPYQSTFDMIVNTTSYVVDFDMLFDIADTVLDYVDESDLNELKKLEPNMVDALFEASFNYNNGQSLEDAINNANKKYNITDEEITIGGNRSEDEVRTEIIIGN